MTEENIDTRRIDNCITETEKIVLPIPKNTLVLIVTAIYNPNHMEGINVNTLSYTKGDIELLKRRTDHDKQP